MKSLELEIRSYIIVFGVAFLVGFLSGCGNTMTGVVSGMGKDISAAGTNLTEWANTPSKKEETKESEK